ncbi:FMN-binding protein [Microbacterium hominis]|uniref:FMN-binding protein n=1 Tax=Microbacterium hominis TaxID=162426 RepID=A0A7D4TML1_9MICO|nr:FMN-binding protein [Microbacterium hominis]QKJ19082.1 FMN-binding protein [Microbacterium hominis]
MKKIVYGLLATLSGLVLLFSYRTSLGEAVPVASALETPAAATGSGSGASAAGSGGQDAAAQEAGAAAAASSIADGTYTGAAADTRYGAVQVQITVRDGRITAVDVPHYPARNGHDRQINSRALPVLVSETLDAQSSGIDMVSGATYTSDGYLQSLQSAIDQAQQ